MGIKVNRNTGVRKLAAEVGKVGAPYAEIGITDPEVATYATYNEYGWVQRTTKKQTGYFLRNFGIMLKPGTPLSSRGRHRSTFRRRSETTARAVRSSPTARSSRRCSTT